MAVTNDLPLTLGRNAVSLTWLSDIIDRASRIAPVSVPLGGEMTPLGYARWRIASPDSGAKTFVAEDPAEGAGPVGFTNQLIGWYVLLEHTGEAFPIVASDADTQTLSLATWSSSLIAGEIFQFRLSIPGTVYSALSYRTSVASVLPPPPGIPIQDAEVTGLAGNVITVRDGWLFGGVGPITVDGQHVGRSVRLSNFVAATVITGFAVVDGKYVYSFDDVSDFQVGDWMRRAAETDGGFSHGDINTLITPAFPAGMTIVAIDTDANTVTVVSRDGLNRVIWDTAVNGPDYNQIRIYRPLADLKTVTASTASPKTLTLDNTTGFSIAVDAGAVEILIATTSSSGKVPWYLDHPIYVQQPPTGIGRKFRTIDRSQDPTAYLGVQNLITNGIGRVATTPGALPDGWLGAASLGAVGSATPSNFIIAKNIDPFFIKTGAQSWFFSTTNGVIYFTPLPWTPMYQGQRVSARLSLLLTKWTGNSAIIELRLGIMQADGTVVPWLDQKRAVLVQPADTTAPRPDPYQKFVANVYDDLVLNDFDITEPSTYNVTNRPNVGDITGMGAGLGLVACLVIQGGGTTVEGYIGGIALVTAHEAPANVQEFYEANKLHQDTNKALVKAGPPQPKISVDFYDAKAMNPTLDEPSAMKGVMAAVDGVGLGIAGFIRRRITDVKRNPNEPGRTQITLDENKIPLATATAKPPTTKPPPVTGGGTSSGPTAPSLAVHITLDDTNIPVATATGDPAITRVKFAWSKVSTPSDAMVRAASSLTGTFTSTAPFALAPGETAYVKAIGYTNTDVESTIATDSKTLSASVVSAPDWFWRRGVQMFEDDAATDAAEDLDRVHVWKDSLGHAGRNGSNDGGIFHNANAIPRRNGNGVEFLVTGGIPADLSGPDIGGITEGTFLIRLKVPTASPASNSGTRIYQRSRTGGSDTMYPDTDGKIKETFGANTPMTVDPAIAGVDLTEFHYYAIAISSTLGQTAWLNGVQVAHRDASAFLFGVQGGTRYGGGGGGHFEGIVEDWIFLPHAADTAEVMSWKPYMLGETETPPTEQTPPSISYTRDGGDIIVTVSAPGADSVKIDGAINSVPSDSTVRATSAITTTPFRKTFTAPASDSETLRIKAFTYTGVTESAPLTLDVAFDPGPSLGDDTGDATDLADAAEGDLIVRKDAAWKTLSIPDDWDDRPYVLSIVDGYPAWVPLADPSTLDLGYGNDYGNNYGG